MSNENLPGGEVSTRPLHFIWICDTSGSMGREGKIESLNQAIQEALPHMRDVADDNPNAEVLVRALSFSSGAQWTVSQPTPVENFQWKNMSASGGTQMGKALSIVADQLDIPPMSKRALPPVLVLISDGHPTDDFSKGLEKLMDLPWGRRAVRVAISIGSDADDKVLNRFIDHPEIEPFQAGNPEQLVRQIRFVSTSVLKSSSDPDTQPEGQAPAGNTPTPQGASQGGSVSENDVW